MSTIVCEEDGQTFVCICLEDGLEIQSCAGTGCIRVPEKLGGHRVTALAGYALSPVRHKGLSQVTEVWLPSGLKRIGKYAFYNLNTLESLHIHGEVEDIGAGAFTGCHQVRRLEVWEHEGRCPCLKEILSELTEELEVRCHGTQEALLYFPEYFEEGVENTPARILENHVHGSGLFFRNSFLNWDFNFREYDRRFPMAEAQERMDFLTDMALGRLRFPRGLEERARERYLGFLEEHIEEAAFSLLKRKEREQFVWLMENCCHPDGGEAWQKKQERILSEAMRQKDAGAVSFLMDFGRRYRKKEENDFEL